MKRLNPFSGLQVSLQDATYWTYETADAIRLRINDDLYNPGVVNGLTIFESGTRAGTLALGAGVAYDANGERIALASMRDQLTYSGALLNDTAVYQVALRYVEGSDGVYGLDTDGLSVFRHITDSQSVVVAKIGADTLQDDDVVVARAFSATAGASLILDNSFREVFSAKYSAGMDLSTINLNLSGDLVVAGTATLAGASITSLFVNNGGLRVTGTACFWRPVVGLSDVQTFGDFYASTSGKGLIVTSPDGTKQARLGVGDDGFPSITPLNYAF